MQFLDWVKSCVYIQPGHYVSVKEMYGSYLADHNDQAEAVISEGLFAKEIWPVMAGLKIKLSRTRGREGRGRGFVGKGKPH